MGIRSGGMASSGSGLVEVGLIALSWVAGWSVKESTLFVASHRQVDPGALVFWAWFGIDIEQR